MILDPVRYQQHKKSISYMSLIDPNVCEGGFLSVLLTAFGGKLK